MKNTFIYTLSCPISGDVRYVGKSNKPNARYSKHCTEKKETMKTKWISDLNKNGLKPILTIIDEIPLVGWKQIEKFYISKYRDLGCDLLNTSIGGEGLDSGNETSFKKGHNAKKVVAINSDGTLFKIFDSILEAQKFIGNNHIWDVLIGKTKRCGGFIWIYESDYLNMTSDDISNRVKNLKRKSSEGSKATQFKKGQTPWNKNLSMNEEYKKNWTKSIENTNWPKLKK